MLITFAALSLMVAQPITTYTRPEPPRTAAQQEEDARNAVSEGERSGDGATPDRLICNWERVPGAIRRERVCRTVRDRAETRDVARETMQEAQRVYTDPVG